VWDAGGWAGYCLKRARRAVPGNRLSFVSPTLKRLVKNFHGQEKAARSTHTRQKRVAPAQGLRKAPYGPFSLDG
jgi:hypothetical protein